MTGASLIAAPVAKTKIGAGYSCHAMDLQVAMRGLCIPRYVSVAKSTIKNNLPTVPIHHQNMGCVIPYGWCNIAVTHLSWGDHFSQNATSSLAWVPTHDPQTNLLSPQSSH